MEMFEEEGETKKPEVEVGDVDFFQFFRHYCRARPPFFEWNLVCFLRPEWALQRLELKQCLNDN